MSWPSKPPGKTRPWVLGHRGDRKRAPENTLSAFQLALEAGADGVEFDVRLSGDGGVIVLHDRDCSRVTGGRISELAENMTLSQLLELELGQGEHIPTLDQVLGWARAKGCQLNVELKSDGVHGGDLVQAVIRTIARTPLSDGRLLLSSFDSDMITELSREQPRSVAWSLAWLVDSRAALTKARDLLPSLGITIVHPKHSLLTGAALAGLKRDGYVVNTWTVNEPERARQLSAQGVDAIITDDPAAIVAALAA